MTITLRLVWAGTTHATFKKSNGPGPNPMKYISRVKLSNQCELFKRWLNLLLISTLGANHINLISCYNYALQV